MSFRDVVPYGLYKDDFRGFRHSIDKLVVDYFFDKSFCFSEFCSQFAISCCFSFRGREEEGYNSYFDKKPSSSYSWFGNAFWFPHCNVKYGLYLRKEVFRGPTKVVEWQLGRVMRVEFNPNKIIYDDLLIGLFRLIRQHAITGQLLECDYAVDVECSPENIVTQSRKDKVVYNDSRYYGKRHSNGRLKVYNKRKEVRDKDKISLDGELSRCEVTCRRDEELAFDSVFYCSSPVGLDGLSSNLKSIASLIILASSYGESREELLQRYVPDKRNRDKLLPVLFGDKEAVFDLMTFLELLSEYCKLYAFTVSFDGAICVSADRISIGE